MASEIVLELVVALILVGVLTTAMFTGVNEMTEVPEFGSVNPEQIAYVSELTNDTADIMGEMNTDLVTGNMDDNVLDYLTLPITAAWNGLKTISKLPNVYIKLATNIAKTFGIPDIFLMGFNLIIGMIVVFILFKVIFKV